MAKTKSWMLLVFASEVYTVVVPSLLLVCSGVFGFHTILNIPDFGLRQQSREIVHLFRIIEILNCLGFSILLADLLFAIRGKTTKHISKKCFFLGLNLLVSLLLYPETISVPIS